MKNNLSIFIIHGSEDIEKYDKLVKILSDAKEFIFINNSFPKAASIYSGMNLKDEELERHLEENIKASHIILIIYLENFFERKWMNYEFELAKKYVKTIISIHPIEQNESCSPIDGMSGFAILESKSVLESIKKVLQKNNLLTIQSN